MATPTHKIMSMSEPRYATPMDTSLDTMCVPWVGNMLYYTDSVVSQDVYSQNSPRRPPALGTPRERQPRSDGLRSKEAPTNQPTNPLKGNKKGNVRNV